MIDSALRCDRPRSLRHPEMVRQRLLHLGDPHVAALTAHVRTLQAARPELEVPHVDPFDGGVAADMLFLLEKPGPRTSARAGGSGLVSRDNDNPTAEALFGFMRHAGIPRARTALWNVVPGWNGTMRLTGPELRDGVAALARLLPLLPMLRTVVLVGRRAELARVMLPGGLRVFASAHPSAQVRAAFPERWGAIPAIWREAAAGG